MANLTRRDLLRTTAAQALAGWTWTAGQAATELQSTPGELRIAPFQFDVTPPRGHSCCGGWIKPVEVIDDQLEAIGFVLLGLGEPIVLCAVDWTALANSAHIQWRAALAAAVNTSPDRVAVQCVHQHNAPFACLDTQALVETQTDLPAVIDREFFQACLKRGTKAVRRAIAQAVPLTHIATGQGQVEQVASNRRVSRDAEGRILAMRGSSCRDPKLRALPDGLIDPWLKTVAFYSGQNKVVACHYYATHPMSYYADGRVTSDFAGLARKRKQAEDATCRHIYFTGCSGNIAAGKYNDGSQELRPILTERVYQGIVRAEADLQARLQPVQSASWSTVPLRPEAREAIDGDTIRKQIADSRLRVVQRNRPAYALAWFERVQQQIPIVLSSLAINDMSMLHLPAECFIQYQLAAQQSAPQRFVATAAYGDGGPWYIPVADEYPCGGYEVSVAYCEPSIEQQLRIGINRLLHPAI